MMRPIPTTANGSMCLGCFAASQPTETGIAWMNGFVTALLLHAVDGDSGSQVTTALGTLCKEHGNNMVMMLGLTAERNHIDEADLVVKMARMYGPHYPDRN